LGTARTPLIIIEETINRTWQDIGILGLRDVRAARTIGVFAVQQEASTTNLCRAGRISIARNAWEFPLAPRTKFTGLLTRWSLTILLIVSHLANATTVSRWGDDATVAALDIQTTMLLTIHQTTDLRFPQSPVAQDAVNRTQVDIAILLLG